MNGLEMQVTFNSTTYNLVYNSQSGFYEIELTAPSVRRDI